MDLSSKPQPSSSWGFSLRSGLQGGFWDKIRGAIEGSVSPVGSAEGERPEIVSAQRSVGPAPRGPQAYWANGRGGKRKPFSDQSENTWSSERGEIWDMKFSEYGEVWE